MRREQRLRANADFSRVRRGKRSWAHPLLVLYAARRAGAGTTTRVGFTAGRRVGGAVVRNRARRRVREAVRARYGGIEPGWDLVFIVRPAVADATFESISAAVVELLERSGLLRTEVPCADSPSA